MINEKKIANVIYQRYQSLLGKQRPIFEDVEFFHQLYRVAMDWDESYPWDYTLTDPVVFRLMVSNLARLNPEGYKVILESRKSNVVQFKQVNQQLINWEFGEINKTTLLLKTLFRGLLAGRGYIDTGWKFQKAIKIKHGDEENSRETLLRDIINRADAKSVRFQDVFIPNHNVPELEEQPYLLQRMYKTVGEMEDENETEGKEIWKQEYLDKIKKQRRFATTVDYGVDLPMDDDSKESMFMRGQYVPLIKHQTKDGEIHYIMENEDQGWILNKSTENEYWHGHYSLMSWTPFPEDDEFFSMGIVQPVSDLAVAITSTLNQFLTNARKAGNPMWIAGKDAKQTPDWMFVNRPDGIVRVNGDIGQIRQERLQDTSSTMITARQELLTSFERGSGMSSLYSSGVSGGSSPQINKTATGARVIDQNIDTNLQLLVTLFGAQIMTKLGETFLELNPQYITEEQEFKITGNNNVEQFVKVKPEEITANFDVSVNPDTVMRVNPVVKQAQLLNLKSTIDQEKDIKFNKVPIWKNIFEQFPEIDNTDDIMKDPEQLANDAITSIEQYAVVPDVTYNEDHKAIITIVQKHIMDAGDSLSDDQLKMFGDYIDEHKKWIEAENPNLFTQPVNQPMLPTNEQDLLQSMMGGVPQNPTEGLPNPTPLDQMGGLPMQ